jgi:hypothetical protein
MSKRLFCDFENQFFDVKEFDQGGSRHKTNPPHSRFASVAADPGKPPWDGGLAGPVDPDSPPDFEPDV